MHALRSNVFASDDATRRIVIVLAAAALLTLACPSAARDIFVNNVAGDDFLTGGIADVTRQGNGPVRTIARALRLAEKGDRVVLANTGEPYRECVTLQAGDHSGYPERPFTIVGNGAVLDGSQPVDPFRWEHVAGDVFRYRPDKMSYQQLFRDGLPLAHRKSDGRLLPELAPLEWSLFDRAIFFRVEPLRSPFDYNLSHAGMRVGITLYEVRHVRIIDLTVQGYQLDGVNAHDSAMEVELLSLTCRGNGRSGISVQGSSRVTIADCLVGNNGAAQVRTEAWSHTRIIDSVLLDNTAPPLLHAGGELTVIDGE